jgi:hypothetical protein
MTRRSGLAYELGSTGRRISFVDIISWHFDCKARVARVRDKAEYGGAGMQTGLKAGVLGKS